MALTCVLHCKRYAEHENSPLPRISLNPSLQSLSDSQLVNSLGICKKKSFIIQHATVTSCVRVDTTYVSLFYRTSGQLLCVWPGVTIIFVNTKKEFSPYPKEKKILEYVMSVGQTKQLRETIVFLLQWVYVK